MKILALQLKRIGDLVLTTPALAALKTLPGAEVTLAVHPSTASLLPAISHCDSAIVFRGGWAPWQQVLTGGFDVVLDFTGTDRSALATFLARARRRITFDWVRRNRFRALPYNKFVDSSVRERHTVDHYLDLLAPIGLEGASTQPTLRTPAAFSGRGVLASDALTEMHVVSPYVVLHPGTARLEKEWEIDRWSAVAKHLLTQHGQRIVITTGPDGAEGTRAFALANTLNQADWAAPVVAQPQNLCDFTALLRNAALVISCDTAAVHLAAAFERPQIALFGPTNPFHWRPRHDRAVVISAVLPDAPMTKFDPRMKGAPMDRISTAVVCRAIDDLLAK